MIKNDSSKNEDVERELIYKDPLLRTQEFTSCRLLKVSKKLFIIQCYDEHLILFWFNLQLKKKKTYAAQPGGETRIYSTKVQGMETEKYLFPKSRERSWFSG